jgi:hypothetical protein
MKHLHVYLFLAAHMLVASICIRAMVNGPPGMFLETLIISVVCLQGSLLGIWAALAGRPAPWRFTALLVLLVLFTRLLRTISPGYATFWGAVVLAQMIGTAVPFFLMRFLGLEVVEQIPDISTPVKYRAQFSIRSLLEWTAAVAILLSALPMMPKDFQELFMADRRLFILGLFATDALLGLPAIWIALGTRRALLRGLVLALMGLILGVFLPMTAPAADSKYIVLMLVLYTLWLTASLWVFCPLGYRLVWRRAIPC